jgi:hypothetical protein
MLLIFLNFLLFGCDLTRDALKTTLRGLSPFRHAPSPSYLQRHNSHHTIIKQINKSRYPGLLGVEVNMAVEDNAHPVLNQELMNGAEPARTVLAEAFASVCVASTPFVVQRGLDPAEALVVHATNQVMDEDEFEGRPAGFQRALEWLTLLRA